LLPIPLTDALLCSPVQEYFYWPSGGTCINELYADTILAAFNTVSELLVAMLPVPVVFRLKMSQTQRWSVLSLISLGFLVAIVGAVRTHYVWILFSTDDLTWWSSPHWICSEVEICVAMVSNNLSPVFFLCIVDLTIMSRSAPALQH
jgi:hypothetical protein